MSAGRQNVTNINTLTSQQTDDAKGVERELLPQQVHALLQRSFRRLNKRETQAESLKSSFSTSEDYLHFLKRSLNLCFDLILKRTFPHKLV